MTTSNGITINTSFSSKHLLFDMCIINGVKFAIFSKPLSSSGDITFTLSDYNVVFLSPIEARNNISIEAISVIALSSLNSKQGKIEINASGKFISLGGTVKSELNHEITGDKGVFKYNIIKERLEMILTIFRAGIASKYGPTIVDALAESFDAIEDPSGEKEHHAINTSEVFNFFGIGLNPEKKEDKKEKYSK